MRVEEFRIVIHEREQCHDEWADGIEKCWKKEIEILTEDISSTIDYLRDECTADEYVCISEVIEDVVECVPSKELVQCYKELMVKYPEESKEYYIADFVESIEAMLICMED